MSINLNMLCPFMLHWIFSYMNSTLIVTMKHNRDVNITVPTVLEVGLYLDECFFTSYNKKWKEIHGDLSMKDYEEAVEDFKIKHIYSHIALTEHKEKVVAIWLQSLDHENYSKLSTVASSKTKENSEMQITIKENSSEFDRMGRCEPVVVVVVHLPKLPIFIMVATQAMGTTPKTSSNNNLNDCRINDKARIQHGD